MRLPRLASLLLLATIAIDTGSARAGQVRVDVGLGGQFFAPTTANLNLGDHVVWVWKSNMHTVTSGNPAACTNAGDGTFNTSPTGNPFNAGTSFSWKSDRTGGVTYYCIPHCPGMDAALNIAASGTAVSSFRITEVRYNSALADSNFIEICNLGGLAGDLGRYRISIQSGAGTVTLPLNDIEVPANSCILVRPAVNKTNNATEFFFAAMPALANTGSAALYAPNSVFASLADPDMVVDFVQWGAGGQPNEGTAHSAALWTAGQFVPTAGPFHSMEFCGLESQHGPSFWQEIALPTPSVKGNCSTPTLPASWGRLKLLYR